MLTRHAAFRPTVLIAVSLILSPPYALSAKQVDVIASELSCEQEPCAALVAVAINGTPITPSSSVTIEPGDVVHADVLIVGWADTLPDGIDSYQMAFDIYACAGSGQTGALAPVGWDAPLDRWVRCWPGEDCPEELMCYTEHAFSCAGPNFNPLLGVYIDRVRDDFVFHGLGALEFVWVKPLSISFAALIATGGTQDPGSPMYAGTLILEASSDACGVFTCPLLNDDRYNRATMLGYSGPNPSIQVEPFRKPLIIEVMGCDCNENGIPDAQDIAEGGATDCNANGIPDECEPDCNDNGIADECDITVGRSRDSIGNGVPDECQPVPTVSEWGLVLMTLMLLTGAKIHFRGRVQRG